MSKTKLLRGYQCLKSFYLSIHHKELEAAISKEQQAVFDIGHLVGNYARGYFKNGILIDNKPWDFIGALRRTRELLGLQEKVLFEGAFEYKGCFARADILKFNDHSGRWSLYEVKASTKVKEEHIEDISLQAWIIAKSGLPIESIFLMHLNPSCRFPNLDNLFHTEDVTNLVRDRYLSVGPKLNHLFKVLDQESPPDIDIGNHCLVPLQCPFKNYCYQERKIPDFSIFNLPQIGEKKFDLYKQGIVSIDDPRLLSESDLSDLQRRVVRTHITHERFLAEDIILSEMLNWKFPLIFLDFETINPAIPRYLGTGPYQQVPYQFSIHKLESIDGEPQHFEFLHIEKSDPRDQLIEALISACGDEGSIVAYYSKFESQRISELAEYSNDFRQPLINLIDRFVDPLPIIRAAIYDEAFRGSFSLKKVAPALLGPFYSYDGLEVSNGLEAQRAFEEIILKETTSERRKFLIDASLEYCKKDTRVLVELVKWLMKISSTAIKEDYFAKK